MIDLFNIPFYELNAWAFWLALFNTILFMVLLVYLFRRDTPIQFVFVIEGFEQGKTLKVTEKKELLKMEEFPHV